jgi:hypothetical protein
MNKSVVTYISKHSEQIKLFVLAALVLSGVLFLLWLTNFMPYQTTVKPF